MVETQVRQILAKHSGLGPAALDIDVTESLWDRGMTSMAAVRVLVALEEGFAVEFPDDKLSTGVFSSVTTIVACLRSLTSTAGR
jgi:acyl carrier protein